jgi:hypothetical protein
MPWACFLRRLSEAMVGNSSMPRLRAALFWGPWEAGGGTPKGFQCARHLSACKEKTWPVSGHRSRDKIMSPPIRPGLLSLYAHLASWWTWGATEQIAMTLPYEAMISLRYGDHVRLVTGSGVGMVSRRLPDWTFQSLTPPAPRVAKTFLCCSGQNSRPLTLSCWSSWRGSWLLYQTFHIPSQPAPAVAKMLSCHSNWVAAW